MGLKLIRRRHTYRGLHPICARCFAFVSPWAGVDDRCHRDDLCCFCGHRTRSGVYVRSGPWDPLCLAATIRKLRKAKLRTKEETHARTGDSGVQG